MILGLSLELSGELKVKGLIFIELLETLTSSFSIGVLCWLGPFEEQVSS